MAKLWRDRKLILAEKILLPQGQERSWVLFGTALRELNQDAASVPVSRPCYLKKNEPEAGPRLFP